MQLLFYKKFLCGARVNDGNKNPFIPATDLWYNDEVVE